jgi:uncharacterized membrane protein HdeD (DUF308 family)
MSTNRIADEIAAGVHDVQRSWGWFFFLGILLMVVGAICMIANVTATFATVLFFGWMLLFSGVVALVHAFRVRTWSGSLLYLLSALLRAFTGYILIRYPLAGAVSLTFVLAVFFFVGGLFRLIGAANMRLPRWGWSAFSGIVSVPYMSVWFVGFAIGVDLIFDGVALVGFATAVHHLPGVGHAGRAYGHG